MRQLKNQLIKMSKISGIIIAKNEEKHLETALKSLKLVADEIIVVDSGSTDSTPKIAKKYTSKYIDQEWQGYGKQKNLALENTTGEWILQIDADEEITTELATEIKNVIQDTNAEFIWFGIITEFLRKPLKHLAGKNLRLFKKSAGRWDDKKVHEQVRRIKDGSTVKLGDSDCVVLEFPLVHHGHYQTLKSYYERQEKYTSADAEEMLKTGKSRAGKEIKVNKNNPFSVLAFLYAGALKQFVKKFFKQKGFLDGCQGILWCLVSAQYEIKTSRKYLDLVK